MIVPHSLKVGFVEGLASPLSFLFVPVTPVEKYESSVESAIEEVGRAFRMVMVKEQREVGKAARAKIRVKAGKRARKSR